MALFDIKKLKENVSKSTERISKQKGKETALKDALAEQRRKEAVFSTRDALHIMYCLMAVDGKISEKESDKLDEIGKALDPHFGSYRENLIEEFLLASRLNTVYGHAFVPQTPDDEEDYYNQIHNYVCELIKEEAFYTTDGMRAKIVAWDLFTIAFSEGDYSANEKRLIQYFAWKAGVDKTVLLEMEHTIRTLMAIEKEEEWIKLTGRTYKVVEERVNELADRKNTIMQGVNALIAD